MELSTVNSSILMIKEFEIHKTSRHMTKPTKWLCAQQWLSSAWASVQSDQSLLWALWVAKDPRFLLADSEASDQTGRMPRLIWVFAVLTLILLVLSCWMYMHRHTIGPEMWPLRFLYCLINRLLHMFFARFLVQHEESGVNYMRAIYFPFLLINFVHDDLRNQNFAGFHNIKIFGANLPAFLNIINVKTSKWCNKCLWFQMQTLIFWDSGSVPFFLMVENWWVY